MTGRNDDYPGDTTQARTCGLFVEVFPIDKPGRVGMAVHNTGPVALTQDEAVTLLRRAANQLATSGTWRP